MSSVSSKAREWDPLGNCLTSVIMNQSGYKIELMHLYSLAHAFDSSCRLGLEKITFWTGFQAATAFM